MITVEQVYGTPEKPEKLPVFKDYLPGDVDHVFFNLDEFAEMRFVDEKEMPIITQKPGVLPYDAHWQAGAKQSFDEGLYRADLILYDANGNEMTNSQISNNLGEDGITVHVEVLQTKTVPVEFSTSGTPAEGYQVTGITSEPESIQICGRSDVLTDVTAIAVPASELNIEGASGRIERTIDITPYLPEGISLVDENTGSVNATVIIEEEGTRSVDFLVSSIRINNLSENLQVVYEPDAEITLRFSGSEELLDILDISNAVSVDLTDYKEPGTYDDGLPVTYEEFYVL